MKNNILPEAAEIQRIVKTALAEDIGAGDVTSQLLLSSHTIATLDFVSRKPMVACGLFIPQAVYEALGDKVEVVQRVGEGTAVSAGTSLVVANGAARTLLAGERVTLNLIQRMCGVATLTHAYVQAVSGTKAIILDTRKTMPGLRAFDKYAVRAGGGQNHRLRLDDMVLIKDNHIALCGGVGKAVDAVRHHEKSGLPIVVECDTLAQVKEALVTRPDRILLDNMTAGQLREAVIMVAGKIPLEASGGVTLDTVRKIAESGVDYISVGALTHSAPAADIGADIQF